MLYIKNHPLFSKEDMIQNDFFIKKKMREKGEFITGKSLRYRRIDFIRENFNDNRTNFKKENLGFACKEFYDEYYHDIIDEKDICLNKDWKCIVTIANFILVERDFKIFCLYAGGMLFKEIAKEIGISEGLVYTRLKKAVKHLREALLIETNNKISFRTRVNLSSNDKTVKNRRYQKIYKRNWDIKQKLKRVLDEQIILPVRSDQKQVRYLKEQTK